MDKLVLGIDDSGRGPVIGPMVMCGVLAHEKDSEKLKSIGVKDSKLLSPQQRGSLFDKIKSIAKGYKVVKLTAMEIDEKREEKNLNLLEAEMMSEIIRNLKADVIYVDCPQKSTEKFKKILISLSGTKAEIVCENYADRNYVIVGAASIIAKVERDKEVREIEKRFGVKVGSGYPADPKTIEFLKSCKGSYPEFVRKSWETVGRMKKQKSLKEY